MKKGIQFGLTVSTGNVFMYISLNLHRMDDINNGNHIIKYSMNILFYLLFYSLQCA